MMNQSDASTELNSGSSPRSGKRLGSMPSEIARGVHAGDLLRRVATVAGGGGGGRPDMAQGGGKDISKIGEALAIVPEAVREMLDAGK